MHLTCHSFPPSTRHQNQPASHSLERRGISRCQRMRPPVSTHFAGSSHLLLFHPLTGPHHLRSFERYWRLPARTLSTLQAPHFLLLPALIRPQEDAP